MKALKILLGLLFLCAFLVAQDSEIQEYDTPVIGIDLGTTYSAVGIYKGGKVEIIPNELGNRITPSVISITKDDNFLVGEAAKNNAPFAPKTTIYAVKRIIGRKYSEILKADLKLLSYDILDKDDRVYITANGKEYTPQQMSSMVLKKMKTIAETYLGTPVKYAVVTVPAYFNDAQRQATKDAGVIAGLNVIRIINEPTAAAMAYGLDKMNEQDVLVYDLGGGTLDCSLMTIDNGTFQVHATSGDMHLGGEDFDIRVTDYFASLFEKKHKKNIRENPRAFAKLKEAAEKAKRQLSTETETTVEIESLMDGIDFKEKLTRAKLEDLLKDLFEKALRPVKQVLKDAKMDKDEIDHVVLVGGSTRVPKIRELLGKFFEGKPLYTEINPDEAIAHGAAIQAAILSKQEGVQSFQLIDVAPLSLGIETIGGVMAKIIERNTPIPTKKSDIFTTTEDYQDTLVVPIYEGERQMTKHNRKLGELILTNIPPARKGVPEIHVQFELDKNSILKVTVEDKATKNRKELTIQKGGLTKEEIERMTKDAETNKEADEKFRQLVEAKQKLEDYASHLKSQMTSQAIAAKLRSRERKEVMARVKSAMEWLRETDDETDIALVKEKIQELRKFADPLIAKAYGRPVDFEEEDEDMQPIKPKTEEPKKKDEL